jgi:enoyl-CoA hydratase/carnithine racemase
MGSVTIEVRGAVAIVVMDNAAHMNAIDGGIAEGLAAAAAELAKREDIGALVLRGAGDRAFCAGVDLKFVEQFDERAQGFALIDESVERFVKEMDSMPIPTIAMLHGNCFGGGVHLAAMADFRFADSALKLGVPAVKARLFYPISALERITDLIGETRTKRLMYEAEPYAAQTLLEWGFLDRVCASDELEARTLEYAAMLAQRPRNVVAVYQAMFRALRRGDAAAARDLRARAKARERGSDR